MTPAQFELDLQRLFELLMAVVLVAFLVERALSMLFGHRLYIWAEQRGFRGFKEPIAYLFSVWLCYTWHFDVLSVLLGHPEPRQLGYWFTAAVLAGGSKASMKLFTDMMDVRTNAERRYRAAGEGGRMRDDGRAS